MDRAGIEPASLRCHRNVTPAAPTAHIKQYSINTVLRPNCRPVAAVLFYRYICLSPYPQLPWVSQSAVRVAPLRLCRRAHMPEGCYLSNLPLGAANFLYPPIPSDEQRSVERQFKSWSSWVRTNMVLINSQVPCLVGHTPKVTSSNASLYDNIRREHRTSQSQQQFAYANTSTYC